MPLELSRMSREKPLKKATDLELLKKYRIHQITRPETKSTYKNVSIATEIPVDDEYYFGKIIPLSTGFFTSKISFYYGDVKLE